MDVQTTYSKNSFNIILIFGLVLFVGLSLGLYFGVDWFLVNFSNDVNAEILDKNLEWLITQIELVSKNYFNIVLPILAGGVLLGTWITWMRVKISIRKLIVQISENSFNTGASKKKDFVDNKIEKERKRRLFLHSISILQRDGRLLDFFDEDLGEYDDEQIGMAVRSIHEDCKKSIKKYINLKPVIEKEEGESIVVEPGFDMDSIKLVGNVSGEPPFEGIVKHPGWKAGKKEVPKLSEVQDSSIISPAEVEIQ